jgi:hypothetical protein
VTFVFSFYAALVDENSGEVHGNAMWRLISHIVPLCLAMPSTLARDASHPSTALAAPPGSPSSPPGPVSVFTMSGVLTEYLGTRRRQDSLFVQPQTPLVEMTK